MRTYGRVYDENGVPSWQVVTTDANGFNDYVYATTLIQNIKLVLGESPFYGNNGIPAQQSIVQQVAPDYYVATMQQQFAPFFANLSMIRGQSEDGTSPTYNVNIVTMQGALIEGTVAT